MKQIKMTKRKALGLAVLAVIVAWIVVLPGSSPYAWVCPSCVLPDVALNTETTFDLHLCNGPASDMINDFRVEYQIFGPNAGTTFYCNEKTSGTVNVPDGVLAPGECVDLELPITFDDANWNVGDDYHMIIWTWDGATPVFMSKSAWDWTYITDADCRARVDSMCPGGVCTCVDEGLTKTPAEAYESFCGGVAWGFDIKSYGGSVTVSIGMVRPSIG